MKTRPLMRFVVAVGLAVDGLFLLTECIPPPPGGGHPGPGPGPAYRPNPDGPLCFQPPH